MCGREAFGSGQDDIMARLGETCVQVSQQNKRPYQLSMSSGVTVFEPGQFMAMESILEQADSEMYARKRAYKRSLQTNVGGD
jgi:GGDEF domain-containing protein